MINFQEILIQNKQTILAGLPTTSILAIFAQIGNIDALIVRCSGIMAIVVGAATVIKIIVDIYFKFKNNKKNE